MKPVDIDATWFVDRAPSAPSVAGGPLSGVDVGVKSNIAVAGLRNIGGSRALDDGSVADADAAAVAALRRAGASIVGTLNMNELAYGFTGHNDHFGRVPNPHSPGRLSGGSSSASAAVIAAGALEATLGTDTNGSARVPAALCGVWGLRPSAGSIDMTGVVPLSMTLDIVGPLAASATLLRAVSAALGLDVGVPPTGERRVAVVDSTYLRAAHPSVQVALDTVARALDAAETVPIDWAEAAFAAAQVVTAYEAAREYGRLLEGDDDRLGAIVRARTVAALDVTEESYREALAVRESLLGVADAIFDDVDVLVTPTVAFPAPAADADVVDLDGEPVPVNAALGRCTAPFSFVGLPALSVPFARVHGAAFPVGVQLVARAGGDGSLLELGALLETAGVAAAWIRPDQG